MTYDVKIYNDAATDVAYVKVDEDGLEKLRLEIDDDTLPDFIEIECLDSGATFAVNRKKIFAFDYKEARG